MIYIYETSSGLRVVDGAHIPSRRHRKLTPRMYRTATDAYQVETAAGIRAALERLGADTAAGPLTHVAVKRAARGDITAPDRCLLLPAAAKGRHRYGCACVYCVNYGRIPGGLTS